MSGKASPTPLTHLLPEASKRADTPFGRNVMDLTARQFVVVVAVARADGLSQTEIMAAPGIDRSSTAELVRRVVTTGWVRGDACQAMGIPPMRRRHADIGEMAVDMAGGMLRQQSVMTRCANSRLTRRRHSPGQWQPQAARRRRARGLAITIHRWRLRARAAR